MTAAILTGVSLLYWAVTLGLAVLAGRRVRTLGNLPVETLDSAPRVSIVVPACNEAASLRPAVATHLRTTHPNVELLLVDDRSTDGTSDIVDELAASDPRIRPIHVTELPGGWLGKVHAMHVGVEHADGDWLLFTDADVFIAPDTISRAVAVCETERRDFLTVIPRFTPTGPALDAAVTTMARSVFLGGQVWRVEDQESSKPAGFGAFLLVRRSTFDRTPGFEALRMEIADDLGIGLLMLEAGARCTVVRATEHVSLRFYDSLADMQSSIEKGGFAIIGRFSVARTIALSVLSPTLELGWLAAFVAGRAPIAIAGLLTGALAAIASVTAAHWLRRPFASALLFPVGIILNAYFTLRSGIIGGKNGGIRWRGTFYPTEELRHGQHVKWP